MVISAPNYLVVPNRPDEDRIQILVKMIREPYKVVRRASAIYAHTEFCVEHDGLLSNTFCLLRAFAWDIG
jgi:hypothetical protein